MTIEERMAMIDKKVEAKKAIEEEKERAYQEKLNKLIRTIESWNTRISDIIKVGNYAIERGINISRRNYSYYLCDAYDNGVFEANGISHRVGFRSPDGRSLEYNKHIECVIVEGGGANGCWDLRSDGILLQEVANSDAWEIKGSTRRPQTWWSLNNFVEDFPIFEEKFYSFLEKYE